MAKGSDDGATQAAGRHTVMARLVPHSLVLASDYRVSDIEEMWSALRARRSDLDEIGAHHLNVYASAREPDRVLVTVGIRNDEPVAELLREPAIFAWFDAAGVDDLPAVFVGEVVEKLELNPAAAGSGVVVAAIAAVDDVELLLADVRCAADRFRAAGLCEFRGYRALDNPREVLILQEFADDHCARRWIHEPDPAAVWMSRNGNGVYPPVFFGQFVHQMLIDDGQAS